MFDIFWLYKHEEVTHSNPYLIGSGSQQSILFAYQIIHLKQVDEAYEKWLNTKKTCIRF
jgi:hypothetical protein